MTDGPAPTEKRAEPRQRCLIEGRAHFDDRLRTRIVSLRNHSSNGAMILCDHAEDLPERFTLVLPQRGVSWSATLRWRSGARAGLSLESTGKAA